jgi:hypothetical protein
MQELKNAQGFLTLYSDSLPIEFFAKKLEYFNFCVNYPGQVLTSKKIDISIKNGIIMLD